MIALVNILVLAASIVGVTRLVPGIRCKSFGTAVVVALGACVLAGLVSFASPCVVPLVPGYLSYLAAVVGVEEVEAQPSEPIR